MTDTLLLFDHGPIWQAIQAGVDGVIDAPDPYTPYYSDPLYGVTSIRAGEPTNLEDSQFRVGLGVTGDHYGSIFLRNDTPHGQASNYVNFLSVATSGNSNLATFRAGPSRALAIRTGSSTVIRTGATNDIPSNTWFRLDWQVTGTTLNWRVFYTLTAASNATPNLSGSFLLPAGTPARLVLGCQSSTTTHIRDWSYDTLRVTNTGTWFGAYTPAAGASGVTVWNGTTEVPATMKVWNGTSEVSVGSWSKN